MKLNSIISVVLSLNFLAFTVSALPSNAADIVTSGQCGDNTYWSLDSEGTFTVSGSGAMNDVYWHSITVGDEECPIDWGEYTPSEWYGQRDKIKRVVIEDGVTKVGFSAFIDCDNLTEIILPDTLQAIEAFSFMHCERLTEVNLPKASMLVLEHSFSHCDMLERVTIEKGILRICEEAFACNKKLSEVKAYSGNCLLDESVPIFSNSDDGAFNGMVYGYEGSTAQAYAEKFGCSFTAFEDIDRGDVDFDGEINAVDASIILREYAITATGQEPGLSEMEHEIADVNYDSATDSSDASSVLAYYAYTATGGTDSLEDFLA